MLSSPFFRRLFLSHLLLICAATGVVGVIASVRLRQMYLQEIRRSLSDEARLVTRLVSGELAGEPSPRLQQLVEEMARETGIRITLVDSDGTVLADSARDPASMDNHAQRPEILAAAQSGQASHLRYSATTHEDMLYFARRLEADGRPLFVRLAVGVEGLRRELRSLYLRVGLVTAAVIAAAGLLAYYLARRQTRPLLELTRVAGRIAGGELTVRTTTTEGGEVGDLAGALDRMADSLSGLLAQADRDRSELLAILGSMSDGVVAMDARQRIVLMNDAAAAMLEAQDIQPVGRYLWEIAREEQIIKAAPRVLAGEQRLVLHLGPRKGRHWEVTLCRYPPAGPPAGLVIVLHDTTESVRYQEMRKEFVANVSHELRTPLSVIKGFIETLRDGAMHDPVRGPQYLATIEKHAAQLANVVNDLLELSRLESQGDLPGRAMVDLAACIRRAADLLAPAAQRKNQTLSVDLPGHLPHVPGNAQYLERAVSNLVDNAIKYTPEGGRISVAARAVNGAVVVEVSDTGIGIPEADIPRIFERFYRVDRSRSRDMGGTGLGLSIVKHIASVHGGTVEVTSRLGAGSAFRLKLPAGR